MENSMNFHPALSWRSIFAGTLVSLFIFSILLSLGIAIGGVSLEDGASLQGSGTFSGIWIVLSIVISLFIAGYFTSRVSSFDSPSVGMAQGMVLAALFSGLVLWQVIGMAGWLTRSAGSVLGGAVQAGAPVAGQAASAASPLINDMIEDNIAGLNLRAEPQTVAMGIASRLIRGDTESAKTYLARNSNLTVPEVNARIDELNARFQQVGADARVATARAMQVSGWSLFAVLVLSLIGAVGGGLVGTKSKRIMVRGPEFTRGGKARPAYT